MCLQPSSDSAQVPSSLDPLLLLIGVPARVQGVGSCPRPLQFANRFVFAKTVTETEAVSEGSPKFLAKHLAQVYFPEHLRHSRIESCSFSQHRLPCCNLSCLQNRRPLSQPLDAECSSPLPRGRSWTLEAACPGVRKALQEGRGTQAEPLLNFKSRQRSGVQAYYRRHSCFGEQDVFAWTAILAGLAHKGSDWSLGVVACELRLISADLWHVDSMATCCQPWMHVREAWQGLQATR